MVISFPLSFPFLHSLLIARKPRAESRPLATSSSAWHGMALDVTPGLVLVVVLPNAMIPILPV